MKSLTRAAVAATMIALSVIHAQASNWDAPSVQEGLEWLDTLGFPNVESCPFVRIGSGGWVDGGAMRQQWIYGFVINQTPQEIELFTTGLPEVTPDGALIYNQLDWPLSVKIVPKEGTKLEPLDFVTTVGNLVRSCHDQRGSENGHSPRCPFRSNLDQNAVLFVLAHDCLQRHLNDLADAVIAEASARRLESPLAYEARNWRNGLENNIGNEMVRQAFCELGMASVSRQDVCDHFRKILSLYPHCAFAGCAADAIKQLPEMIAEDNAHKVVPDRTRLSKQDQIAELIFQLREQKGVRWDIPGQLDIFVDRSPSLELLKFGNAAIPQLTAALNDPRLTRAVYGAEPGHTPGVLRVGYCAQRILEHLRKNVSPQDVKDPAHLPPA